MLTRTHIRPRLFGVGLASLLTLNACADTPLDPSVDLVTTSRANAVYSASCMAVSASDSSLVLGDSASLSSTATAVRRNGRTITGPVSWRSSDSTIVRIVGTYARSLRVGSVVLSATLSSCNATLPMSVADKPGSIVDSTVTPPPTAPRQLLLNVTLIDSSRTAPIVSNGLPLPKGYLFEKDLPTAALSDGSREIARVLRPLAGRYPDGSVRSVLLQFQGSSTLRQVTLLIGGTRTVAEPTGWPIPSGLPEAVAFPADRGFLLSTLLVGPTVSVQDSPIPQYETQFMTYAEKHFQLDGSAWDRANYYDRALNHFTYWIRSGNLVYWRRAIDLALDYRRNYIEANNFNPSPHWMLLEGLAVHYWLTGDEQSRQAVMQSAANMTAGYTPERMANPLYEYSEGRILARALLGSLLSWELGDISQDWRTKTTAYAQAVSKTQRADGAYAWPAWCYLQSNYMVGLQNDAMIKYYERHTADPTVVTTVKRAVDYMRTSSWLPLERSFAYMDGTCPNVGDRTAAPDLNMLIVTGPAFIGAKTGDRSYIAFADSIATGAMDKAWLDGSKQFNQQYYNSHQWLWYRR